MYKAIVTRYHGPTNTKPTRISARAEGVSTKWMSYHYDRNNDDNHELAASVYANSLGWLDNCHLIGGCLPNQDQVWILREEN
jgi:hypothetical protein